MVSPDRLDHSDRTERRGDGTDAVNLTPRERRDLPWIVAAGVAVCVVIILIAAWRTG
jgi:hypothetical protein